MRSLPFVPFRSWPRGTMTAMTDAAGSPPPPRDGRGGPPGGWSAPGSRPLPPPAGGTPPQTYGTQPPAYDRPGPPGGPGSPGAGWGASGPGWLPQAPKPGIVPLRPLGLTEILDGAITAIRMHPRAMLGLSAIVLAAVTLLQLPLQWVSLRGTMSLFDQMSASSPGFAAGPGGNLQSLGIDAVTALSTVLTLLVQLVLTGLLTVVVSRAVIGQRLSIGEAWTAVRGRVPALLGAAALTTLAVIGVILVAIAPAVAVTVLGAPLAVVVLAWIATVFVVIAAIAYVYTTFALAGPAVVLERLGPVAGIARSRTLVRHSFWRVFGILLLAAIITVVLTGIFQLPFVGIGTFVAFLAGGESGVGLVLMLALIGLGTVLAGTLTAPFAAGVTVLVYIDRRIRREGLDLELARAAGITVPGTSVTPGAPGGGGPGGGGPGGRGPAGGVPPPGARW